MPVNRLDYTENRDGGNHGKFDVFLSKAIPHRKVGAILPEVI